ncbi:MoaD/ThiS family protein [Candidatus Bipolaricaulota bacterium]|nr:MoaD/ThiS family protein [Candidatus Bipolaricaulota bacterium]
MVNELEVHLHGGLDEFANRDKVNIIQVASDVTVQDVCRKVGLSKKEVYLVSIDGKQAKFEREISDGKKLDIYPVFGGG